MSRLKVGRIVANIPTPDPAKADAFYHRILRLKLVIDQGCIRTYASSEQMPAQITFASEGGSGAPMGVMYGINLGCLENVSDQQLSSIPIAYVDGRNDKLAPPEHFAHL